MSDITTIEELAQLIAERDKLSYEDSLGLVQEVKEEIESLLEDSEDVYCLLFAIEDLIESKLGLEPDYIDMFGVL